MEIHEHAIDRYIERVLGFNPEMAGDTVRQKARLRLEDVAIDPVWTYEGKKDKPPVHIKGDVAVPVDGNVVPSAYHSQTFKKKMDA